MTKQNLNNRTPEDNKNITAIARPHARRRLAVDGTPLDGRPQSVHMSGNCLQSAPAALCVVPFTVTGYMLAHREDIAAYRAANDNQRFIDAAYTVTRDGDVIGYGSDADDDTARADFNARMSAVDDAFHHVMDARFDGTAIVSGCTFAHVDSIADMNKYMNGSEGSAGVIPTATSRQSKDARKSTERAIAGTLLTTDEQAARVLELRANERKSAIARERCKDVEDLAARAAAAGITPEQLAAVMGW